MLKEEHSDLYKKRRFPITMKSDIEEVLREFCKEFKQCESENSPPRSQQFLARKIVQADGIIQVNNMYIVMINNERHIVDRIGAKFRCDCKCKVVCCHKLAVQEFDRQLADKHPKEHRQASRPGKNKKGPEMIEPVRVKRIRTSDAEPLKLEQEIKPKIEPMEELNVRPESDLDSDPNSDPDSDLETPGAKNEPSSDPSECITIHLDNESTMNSSATASDSPAAIAESIGKDNFLTSLHLDAFCERLPSTEATRALYVPSPLSCLASLDSLIDFFRGHLTRLTKNLVLILNTKSFEMSNRSRSRK